MRPERYQRIKAILADVLDTPDADRPRVLAHACGDDADLRSEVESLLRHEAADGFLEPILSPLVPQSPLRPAPTAGDRPDPRLGRTICGYRVIRRIGGGGMGVVYEAEDTHRGHTVALKCLRPDLLLDPTVTKRFWHEARAGALLRHPHICEVYGIEETEDRELFLVMAYCEGETLRSRLTRGELGFRESVTIASAVGRALATAHGAGVIHRDVKPGNIMLTPSGVKLLDFGIAKVRDHTSLTVRGTTVGTAAYSSPEQAEGGDVDHRTDVFSLGVVLHEMLTGRRPFDVTPATGPLGSAALRRFFVRALAADRDRRFSSMDEMLGMLETVERDHVPAPTPARTAERLADLIDRVVSGQHVSTDALADAAVRVAEDTAATQTARTAAIRYLYFLGEFESSARGAADLLRSAATPVAVRFDLAASLTKTGDYARALEMCDEALACEDGRLLMMTALGHAAAGRGQQDRGARALRHLEASPNGAALSAVLRDAGFGATTRPLEYFGPTPALPDLAGYLALRRLPGSLAALADRIGLIAYLGFDADLNGLTAAPLARALVQALEHDDA